MRIIFKTIVIVFVSLFIFSCKDSDPVTPGSNEPVVLFSRDSLALSSSDTGMLGLIDSVLFDIDTSVTRIKLDYRMESTGGAALDRIYYGVFLSKPGVSFFADYGYLFNSKIIDSTSTLDVSSYRGLTLKFKVAIEKKTDPIYRYVRFRNMKLSQIN